MAIYFTAIDKKLVTEFCLQICYLVISSKIIHSNKTLIEALTKCKRLYITLGEFYFCLRDKLYYNFIYCHSMKYIMPVLGHSDFCLLNCFNSLTSSAVKKYFPLPDFLFFFAWLSHSNVSDHQTDLNIR